MRLIAIVVAAFCAITTAIEASIPIEKHFTLNNAENLALRLIQNPLHNPEVYSRAVSVLESLQSSPSCHRMATVSLIDSCQSLESSKDAEIELAEVREKYAARLAMCELIGAQITLPKECRPFVASKRHCKSRGRRFDWHRPIFNWNGEIHETDYSEPEVPCYPDTSRSQLNSCLNTLHSKPQMWMSYSNALQNVLVVCQASRGAAEQDEIIRVFRTSTSMTSELTMKLAETLRKSANFSAQIERIREQSVEDWIVHVSELRSFFGNIVQDLSGAVRSVLAAADNGAASISHSMDALHEKVKGTHDAVAVTEGVLTQLTSNSAAHNQKLQEMHAAALNTVNDQSQHFQEAMLAVYEHVPEIHELLSTYSQRLQNFSQAISENNDLMGEQITRNTLKLEEQVEIINKVAEPATAFASSLLGIGLVVMFQTILPEGHNLGVLFAFLTVLFLAVLRQVIGAPWKTIKITWRVKGFLGYQLNKISTVGFPVQVGLIAALFIFTILSTIIFTIFRLHPVARKRASFLIGDCIDEEKE